MRISKLLIVITVGLTYFACFYWLIHEREEIETITYFPLDEMAEFIQKKTSIGEISTGNDVISLPITIRSQLNQTAYLRQDISLVFGNGRLIGKLGKWGENTDTIHVEDVIQISGDQIIRAISDHHAEIHRGEKITSSQTMSEDIQYIVTSNEKGGLSFKTPKTKEEEKWEKKLNRLEVETIRESVARSMYLFNLNSEHYNQIPLTELPLYETKPLPSFTQQQTNEIIGQLWEGLYKNYFLNIRTNDGRLVSPIGSTIPVILLAKDKSHLYVIFETQNQEPILLKQLIQKP